MLPFYSPRHACHWCACMVICNGTGQSILQVQKQTMTFCIVIKIDKVLTFEMVQAMLIKHHVNGSLRFTVNITRCIFLVLYAHFIVFICRINVILIKVFFFLFSRFSFLCTVLVILIYTFFHALVFQGQYLSVPPWQQLKYPI